MAKWNTPIELPADPTVALGAATKQYVDSAVATTWTEVTQAEYDALSPPDPNTLYVISGPTPSLWKQLTQAQYDALSPPDPNTLYVIIG